MDHLQHLQHLQHLVALERGATVKRYVVRDRMNPFQSYSNEEFVARYRVTKECVTELLETIRRRLAVVHNNRGEHNMYLNMEPNFLKICSNNSTS